MKILLTSAGFENKRIENKFKELVGKKPEVTKALFIPTAANFPEAIAVLPKCKADLLNAGIPEENITEYNLDRNMSYEELKLYDAVYFCGGDPGYLLERMYADNFTGIIKRYVTEGGIYIGVSAGSLICADNYPKGLGFISCRLDVHCQKGTKEGHIETDRNQKIALTNQQAILITDDDTIIIE